MLVRHVIASVVALSVAVPVGGLAVVGAQAAPQAPGASAQQQEGPSSLQAKKNKKRKAKKAKKNKKKRSPLKVSTSHQPPPPLAPGSTAVGAAQMAIGGNDARTSYVRTEANKAVVSVDTLGKEFPSYAEWTHTGQGNRLPCTDGVNDGNCKNQADPWSGFANDSSSDAGTPLAAADVNGDGLDDLAALNGNVLNIFRAEKPGPAGDIGNGSYGLAGSEKAPWGLKSAARAAQQTVAVKVRPEGYRYVLRGAQVAVGQPDQSGMKERIAVVSDRDHGSGWLTVVGGENRDTARVNMPDLQRPTRTGGGDQMAGDTNVAPMAVTWADVDGMEGGGATGQEVVTATLVSQNCVKVQVWRYTPARDYSGERPAQLRSMLQRDVCAGFPIGQVQMVGAALAPGRGEQIALVLEQGNKFRVYERNMQVRILGSTTAFDGSGTVNLQDLTPDKGIAYSGQHAGDLGGGRLLAVSSPASPGLDTLILVTSEGIYDRGRDFLYKYQINAARFVPEGWGQGGKTVRLNASWGHEIGIWERKDGKVIRGDLSKGEVARLAGQDRYLDASASDVNVDGWDDVVVILPDQDKRGRAAPWVMQSNGPITGKSFDRDWAGAFPPEGGRDRMGEKPTIVLFNPKSNGMIVGRPEARLWHDSPSAQFMIDAPPTHADWLVKDYGEPAPEGVGMTVVGDIPAADSETTSTITVSNTRVPDFGGTGGKFFPRLGTQRERATPVANPVMEVIRIGEEYMRITDMSQTQPSAKPVELTVTRNVPGPDGVASVLPSAPAHPAGSHVSIQYPVNLNYTTGLTSICYGFKDGPRISECSESSTEWKNATSSAATSSVEKKNGWTWGASLEYSKASIAGISGKMGAVHKGAKTQVDTDKTSNKVTLSSRLTASKDDMMLATKTSSWIFKYPAWLPGKSPALTPPDSYVSMAVPVAAPRVESAFTKNEGQVLTSPHEVGNILSYPTPYGSVREAPGFGSQTCRHSGGGTGQGDCSATWIKASTAGGYEASMNWEDTSEKTVKNSSQTDLGGYFEATLAFPPFVDLGRAVGSKWTLKGDFNNTSAEETLTGTTVSKNTTVGLNVPNTGSAYAYSLQPYLYWTDQGTLRLTFATDVLSGAGTWWRATYNKPDLTFVRPWHMDAGEFRYLVGRTTGMAAQQVLDSKGQPTQKVSIKAMVKNYSMVAAPRSTITFYAGKPSSGKVIATTAVAPMRGQGQFVAEAEVPEQFQGQCIPVYAAVTDAGDELRTDNNTAYSWLAIPNGRGQAPACDPDRKPADKQAGPVADSTPYRLRMNIVSVKVARGPNPRMVRMTVRIRNKRKVTVKTPVILTATRPKKSPVVLDGEYGVSIKPQSTRKRTYTFHRYEVPRKVGKWQVSIADGSPVRGKNRLLWERKLTKKEKRTFRSK